MNLLPESNLLILSAVYANAAWHRAYRQVKESVGICAGIFCFFLVELKYIVKVMFIEKDFTLDEPGKSNIYSGDGEYNEIDDSPTKEK